MEAYRPANGDGDNFLFEYSTDGSNYSTLLTVASATEQLYTASLPASTSGTVYVRVTDTNRSFGAESLDDLFVDYLVIETAGTQPLPPVADFSGSPISGYAPLTVDFSDQSSNAPDSWTWDFGDGGGSSEANPTYVYAAPGSYTVSLTVSNAYGSDSEVKTGYITVNENTGGGTMHVFDIAVSRKTAGPNNSGVAVITIHDSDSQPVEGATVYATASGPVPGDFSGLTQANGTVRFETGKTKNASGEWCFAVTNLTHATLDYNPADNVVTEACESGYVQGAEDVEFVGEDFALGNYPDPFNPVTVIAFKLPEASQTRLQIFNVQGQRVAVLEDGHLEAGIHRYRWDASQATSGVYFYRLEIPGRMETRKMVLLK
jgi:PKD repeat protein